MPTNEEIEEIRRKWRENIPDKHHGAYRRTWDKAMARKSFRSAVTAKCQDCCCWVKAEITDCRVYHCPLYEYRPYQGSTASNPTPQTPIKRGVLEKTAAK